MHCSNYARRVRWNGTNAVLLFTFVSFHSGTQISEQQTEHWPEVSTDVEMRWSEEKIRELSIYLNEDAPATPHTCSSSQHQDTRSISAEIVTNMAAGDVSTARIAAATMHQDAVTSSTAACIHQHTYQEETNERTSGMSYNYDERRRWLVFSRKYVCTRYVVQVCKHFIVPIPESGIVPSLRPVVYHCGKFYFASIQGRGVGTITTQSVKIHYIRHLSS